VKCSYAGAHTSKEGKGRRRQRDKNLRQMWQLARHWQEGLTSTPPPLSPWLKEASN